MLTLPLSQPKLEYAKGLEEKLRRQRQRQFYALFPDEGPLRRELYPKHTEFFAYGAEKKERAFVAANRIGKSVAGGYEIACHLTGFYPHWWTGRRFDKPVKAWVAGDTSQTVRDILQGKLLGPVGDFGTGIIPGATIIDTKRRAGNVPDLVETVRVKHVSGVSTLGFKSYDQGREAFQGTEQDIIWLDEEPPVSVYTECLMRTMTTQGIVMLTFTPLRGLSDVVLSFLPDGRSPEGKCVVMATWDDVPHLSETDKADMLAAMPPHMRDARSKGIPALGSGAIYPVAEAEIAIPDFDIPDHWPRIYGMDVGWNNTAAVWGAWDREQDCVYVYSEYKRGQAEPSAHAAAIKLRGDWISGVIDPASAGAGQKDGIRLIDVYKQLGLELFKADNQVEAGLLDVYRRLAEGRMKIFRSCQKWLSEFRLYRRDEKGRVVKDNDHLMDATRYLVMSGLPMARVKVAKTGVNHNRFRGPAETAWMGA